MALPNITKSIAVRVQPASATPTVTLPLSSIDRKVPRRIYTDSVSVFTHGEQAAAHIRDALGKALVHYYPVAGKLTEVKPGELEVECTSEGIWFFKAKANCSLEEVNYLERPLMVPKEQLLPQAPPEAKLQYEIEIIMVQVTEFTCGGFTVGVCSSHVVFDGLGLAQFLKAVGEMACGLPELTVKPVWSRENIPNPLPKVPNAGPPPSFTLINFATLEYDISVDSINQIKDLYMAETGKRSSTFEVVTAMIVKCRARAIDLAPEAEFRIGFSASIRHLLHGVLPSVDGYYGNCMYMTARAMSTDEINKASLVEVISLIKAEKETVSTKFADWMNGRTNFYHHIKDWMCDYGTMIVSDWSKIGLDEVDYGWGPPSHVIPLKGSIGIFGAAFYVKVKPPLHKNGIRLILRCVKEEHSAVFCDELSKFA